MGKKKKTKELSYEYWNRLLAKAGLSLFQGRNPKLIYVGGSPEVENVEIGRIKKASGRVTS